MITDIDQLDFSKTYNYTDYLKWRFSERVELIKGIIHRMSPAPSLRHQKIVTQLTGEIYQFLKHKECQIFTAPFDVRLPLPIDQQKEKKIDTVVQPDITIVCDKHKLDKQGCNGAPDLLIEVLSPGNTKKEMKEKFNIYEAAGVQEYWLIHSKDNNALVFNLDDKGKYQLSSIYTEDDVLESKILHGFKLNLLEVFRN